MKSQVLLTLWCSISGEAAGEIWNWSLVSSPEGDRFSFFHIIMSERVVSGDQWIDSWIDLPTEWSVTSARNDHQSNPDDLSNFSAWIPKHGTVCGIHDVLNGFYSVSFIFPQHLIRKLQATSLCSSTVITAEASSIVGILQSRVSRLFPQ